MKRKSLLVGVFAASVLFFGIMAHAHAAEEGKVKALSSFTGTVDLFKVEGAKAYAVGVWGGVLFFEGKGGSLEAASLSCPGTLELNLATGEDTGTGRCIITAPEGDKAYAKWTCSGNARGCDGPFTLVGGTGRFHGISGESTFSVLVGAKMFTAITSTDSLEYVSMGLMVWPELNYKIP